MKKFLIISNITVALIIAVWWSIEMFGVFFIGSPFPEGADGPTRMMFDPSFFTGLALVVGVEALLILNTKELKKM